jgi:hypothetical protein
MKRHPPLSSSSSLTLDYVYRNLQLPIIGRMRFNYPLEDETNQGRQAPWRSPVEPSSEE